MRALTLVALLAVPAAAQTIYSWEDAEGVHYTDDLGQVPKSAKVAAELVSARPPAASPPRPTVVAAVAPNQPQQVEGVTERAWRERFIGAHRRITTLEQSIAAARASLPPRTECVPQPVMQLSQTQVVTQNGTTTVAPITTLVAPRTRCAVNPEHDRLQAVIAQQEVALRDARTDLEQLDRRASYDGVPREWRRGW